MAKKFTAAEDFFTSPAPEETNLETYNVPKGYQLKPLPRSARVQILVTQELKDNMKAIAIREGISVNELINKVMSEYVSNNI